MVAALALDIWTAQAQTFAVGLAAKPNPARDGAVAALEGVRGGDFRLYDRGYLKYRPGVRLGVRDFGGYEDDPLGLRRYRRFLELAERDPTLLGHANVRYLLLGDPRRRLPTRGLRPLPGLPSVFELSAVAPRVLYVADAESASSSDAAFAALGRLKPGRGAIVEGPAPRGPAGAEPVIGTVAVDEPDRLIADIQTPGPGIVVVNEAYYPGWSATVDGEEVAISPANGLFRAVPVASAGRHRIVMRFLPRRFYWLLPAYAAAIVALSWALASGWRRRRGR